MTWRGAAALAVAAASGFIVVAGLRTARAEWAAFHPPRVAIVRPASLAGVAAMRDVVFATVSGARMHGWWIPSRNGAAVVLAHGSSGSRMDLAWEASVLEAAGFGVLLFDWPGNGESEGAVTFGSGELDALRSAVSFVEAEPGVDRGRIGALGASMGAALVVVGAAHDPRLHALAIASAFTDSDEQTRYEYHGSLSTFAALWVDHRFMESPLRPIDAAPALAGRPVLYIAGADDPVVPTRMSGELRDASGPRAELWVVPGGRHGNFEVTTGGAYSTRVVSFFKGALAR